MSRSIWHLALTSIAVALSPLTAVEWHRIQPNEKSVSVFEIDPHHPGGLYAVAGDELLWSPNRGDEWVSLLDIDVFVDGQGHIQAFAVDQHDPQALYLGIRTTQPYLLKSDDRGYTWTLMDFSGDWFYHLGSDPHHPGALFAATDEGVLKSRDAGDSWTHLYSGPPGYYGHYNDLLIHPLQPRPPVPLCRALQLQHLFVPKPRWRDELAIEHQWAARRRPDRRYVCCGPLRAGCHVHRRGPRWDFQE